MDIQQLIDDVAALGVLVSLTPEDTIRLDGDKSEVRAAARAIRPHRAEVIAYLKSKPGAEILPPTGALPATLEVGDGDAPRFTHCPHCQEPLFAPAPEVMVQNLRRFQHDRTSYFWWTDEQLERLLKHLAANPGDVSMLPAYAHSINIRRPDGSLYTWKRAG